MSVSLQFLLRQSWFDALMFNVINDTLLSDSNDLIIEYIVHLNTIYNNIQYTKYSMIVYINIYFSSSQPCFRSHLL